MNPFIAVNTTIVLSLTVGNTVNSKMIRICNFEKINFNLF